MTITTTQIADIVGSVMYLDDPTTLDSSRSLFTDYGMSSLDFVDFAFELRSATTKDFTPDDLWPVSAMLTDRTCFAAGTWTDTGRERLQTLFGDETAITGEPTATDLYAMFSIAFVERRLQAI